MTNTARPVQIAVCGPGDAPDAALGLAEAVGRELARRGAVVVCGGLGGCMEAVCRGAKGAGGTTVGILPGYEPRAANDFVDISIVTGIGQARNAVVAATGSAMIAIAGGPGTLSEVAMAVRLARPVVLLGWPPTLEADLIAMAEGLVRAAPSPDAAVTMALGID